jgi:hypothetical protein
LRALISVAHQLRQAGERGEQRLVGLVGEAVDGGGEFVDGDLGVAAPGALGFGDDIGRRGGKCADGLGDGVELFLELVRHGRLVDFGDADALAQVAVETLDL